MQVGASWQAITPQAQHSTAQHSTAQHSTAQHSSTLHTKVQPACIKLWRLLGALCAEAEALQPAGHAAQDGRQLSVLGAQQAHHAQQLLKGPQIKLCSSAAGHGGRSIHSRQLQVGGLMGCWRPDQVHAHAAVACETIGPGERCTADDKHHCKKASAVRAEQPAPPAPTWHQGDAEQVCEGVGRVCQELRVCQHLRQGRAEQARRGQSGAALSKREGQTRMCSDQRR